MVDSRSSNLHDSKVPASMSGSRRVRNDREALTGVVESVMRAMESVVYGSTSMFAVRLAIEEAVANGFKHGGGGSDEATVEIDWAVDRDSVRVSVEDGGAGFDPGAVPDPTEPDRLEVPSGRGLMLMRAYMTELWHNDRGNRVTMVYRRPAEGGD